MKVIITSFFLLLMSASNISAKDSLTLYLFLLDDCPICIQYTPTINHLHSKYGNDVSFVGYFPNFSSKKNKIEAFRNKYNLEFPLLTDYYKTQAKRFNAQVTPEVVLYNHTTDTVVYQGRIDNKFYKLGRRRNVVTVHDLDESIAKALLNIPVDPSFVAPIGCFINYGDDFNIKTKDK